MLKQVTIAIGWLSGSLTGVLAVLYGFGYLVTRGHLYVMGLDPVLIAFPHDYYIRQGTSFLAVSARILADYIRDPVILVSALACLAAGVGLVRCLAGRINDVTSERSGTVLRAVAFSALLGLLLVWMPSPQELENVLSVQRRPSCGGVAPMADFGWRFQTLLVGGVGTLGVVAVASYVIGRWRSRVLLMAPFAAAALYYAAFLPIAFGALAVPVEFSRAMLVPGDAGEALATGREEESLLLQATSDEFLLWDCAKEALVWVPKRTLRQATFRPPERAVVTKAPSGVGQR